jgi:hypothetical protein
MKLALLLIAVVLLSTESSNPGMRAQSAHPGNMVDEANDDGIINRFLQSGAPDLISYRARRVLAASTRGGRMHARIEAMTQLDADGGFTFRVLCAEGSGLLQKRVLVAALEAEQRSRQQRTMAQAALSPDNYDLQPARAPATEGVREIVLRPRRRSEMLVVGSAYVEDPSADLMRVEGQLSKTPSWWTRRVTITRNYARIAGVRVPVAMTSVADVRLVGAGSFAMTYDYKMINGRTVVREPASQGSVEGCGSRTETGGLVIHSGSQVQWSPTPEGVVRYFMGAV